MVRVIIASNGLITIRWSNGQSTPTGISVPANTTEAQIPGIVEQVRRSPAVAQMRVNAGLAEEPEATRLTTDLRTLSNVLTRAIRHHRNLETPARRGEVREAGEPPRRGARGRTPGTPGRETRDREPATETPTSETPTPARPPAPVITTDWVRGRLNDARWTSLRRGTPRARMSAAVVAVDALRVNSASINTFLAAGTNRREVAIQLFNMLLENPTFADAFLQAQTGTQEGRNLVSFISANNGRLLDSVTDPILNSAVLAMRRYVLILNDSNYRAEVAPLNIQGSGPLDASLLTAIALEFRRENVPRNATVEQWTAPQVVVAEEPARQPLPQPIPVEQQREIPNARRETQDREPATGGRTPRRGTRDRRQPRSETPDRRPTTITLPQNPNIMIIGDSLTDGGVYATALRQNLTDAGRRSRVRYIGVSGMALHTMRLPNQIFHTAMGETPTPNIIIIEGGLNDLGGLRTDPHQVANRIIGDFEYMIQEATRRNPNIIIVIPSLTPWGNSDRCTGPAQQATDEVNARILGTGDYAGQGLATRFPNVITVDMSSLGEGTPLHYRSQYQNRGPRGTDWLHPNSRGRIEIGRLLAQGLLDAGRVRTPTTAPELTPLERWERLNWGGERLISALSDSVQRRRPDTFLFHLRNLPPRPHVDGEPDRSYTLPEALNEFERQDLRIAFDRVFNEYLRGNAEFRRFLEQTSGFNADAICGATLSVSSSVSDRQTILRAINAFLVQQSSATQGWHHRLGQDLDMLYSETGRFDSAATQPDATPTQLDEQYLIAVAALSVYSWRSFDRNRTAEPGGRWAQPPEPVTEPQSQQPVQPRRPQDSGRRINLGR